MAHKPRKPELSRCLVFDLPTFEAVQDILNRYLGEYVLQDYAADRSEFWQTHRLLLVHRDFAMARTFDETTAQHLATKQFQEPASTTKAQPVPSMRARSSLKSCPYVPVDYDEAFRGRVMGKTKRTVVL